MFLGWKQSSYRFAFIGLVLAPMLLSGQTLYSQGGSLYLPLLNFSGANQIGLALSNPSVYDADLTVTAFSEKGSLLEGLEKSNPAEITIPAKGQSARLLREIFGDGILGKRGWVEISGSEPGVSGIYVLLNGSLTAVDGGLLIRENAARLVFPNVAFDTTIAFVNAWDVSLHADLKFFDNRGNVRGLPLDLKPYQSIARSPVEMAAGLESFSGWAVLEATEATEDSAEFADALVGAEVYRRGSDIAVLTAPSLASASRQAHIPHFASGAGYTTRVFVVNPSEEAQTVQITLQADSDSRSRQITQVIPPHGRLDSRLDQAFSLTSATFITGALKLEVTGGGKGVLAFAEISTGQGLVTALAAEAKPLSDYFFSHVAQDRNFYTGTVLLNPGTAPAHVTIDVFDQSAELVGARSFSLLPGKRIAQVLNELVPGTSQVSAGGYVHITATEPVFAVQLFGSRQDVPFLANVPTMGTALEPLTSGAIVDPYSGGIVISNDGTARLAIPPGALDWEEEVRIDVKDAKTYPPPHSTTIAAAAIQTGPTGTEFNLPAKLTFDLSGYFNPGARIPLLVWNSDSKSYSDADSMAIVDDSGRTASADVTELATYVVELENLRRLAAQSLSPDRGLGGTRVTITGGEFSADPSRNIVTFAGPEHTEVRAEVTAASATSLTVIVPEGAISGPVVIRTGSSTSAGLWFTMLYNSPQPALTSISPAFAVRDSLWIEVRLAGTGFTRNTRVQYDGSAVDSRYIDATHLAVVLREAQLGTGNHRFTVNNPEPGGGTSGTLEFQVRYPSASIESVTPDRGPISKWTSVTLIGSGFTQYSSVRMGIQPMPSIFIDSNTMEVMLYSTAPGPVILTVINPSPTTEGSVGVFKFELP